MTAHTLIIKGSTIFYATASLICSSLPDNVYFTKQDVKFVDSSVTIKSNSKNPTKQISFFEKVFYVIKGRSTKNQKRIFSNYTPRK